MTTREVLLKAADRYEAKCHFDALTAIAGAATTAQEGLDARMQLRKYLDIDSILDWQADKTAAEIIAALRGAADTCT